MHYIFVKSGMMRETVVDNLTGGQFIASAEIF